MKIRGCEDEQVLRKAEGRTKGHMGHPSAKGATTGSRRGKGGTGMGHKRVKKHK